VSPDFPGQRLKRPAVADDQVAVVGGERLVRHVPAWARVRTINPPHLAAELVADELGFVGEPDVADGDGAEPQPGSLVNPLASPPDPQVVADELAAPLGSERPQQIPWALADGRRQFFRGTLTEQLLRHTKHDGEPLVERVCKPDHDAAQGVGRAVFAAAGVAGKADHQRLGRTPQIFDFLDHRLALPQQSADIGRQCTRRALVPTCAKSVRT